MNIEQRVSLQTNCISSLTYIEMLRLKRPHSLFKAYLCISMLSLSDLMGEKNKFLHPVEREYLDSLSFKRRQKSFLIGRYCAKQALSAYFNESNMSDILINNGVFKHPTVQYVSKENIQISISHSNECGGAIAFPEEHPMAIDIEKIDQKKTEVIKSQCTIEELNLIKSLAAADITQLTILWTVKEALSKVLKCGMMSPFTIFEINHTRSESDYFVFGFKNFSQYKCISFIIEKFAFSIILPKKTEFIPNITAIRKLELQ